MLVVYFFAELILLRKTFFFHDEWTFIHQILLSPTSFILTPHNGHFWPLFAGIYFLMYRFFGLNYWPYQFVLLIVHFANIYFLYSIIGLLSKNKFVAFCFSLIFLVSSTYWEVLFSASTLPTVLCLFFINLGIYFYLIYEKRQQNKHLYFSGVSLLLSSFSWGAGLFFPLIFILFLITKAIGQKKIQPRELIIYLLIQAISILVYIYFSGKTATGAFDLNKVILFTAAGIKWLTVSFYTSSPGFTKIFFIIAVLFGLLLYQSLRTRKNRMTFRSCLSANIPWLIFTVSGVFYFYFISALSRSQIDMRLALSSRYTYLPLYFLVIFNSLVVGCWLSGASLRMKKLLFVYFLGLFFANIYFFRIYYRSWTETISIPNKKLFLQIAHTSSKEERAKISIPSTFHDFYKPEDIYFIHLRSRLRP